MNTAIIVSENAGAEADALQARIAKLRASISRERAAIHSLAEDVRRADEDEERGIEKVHEEYRKSVERLTEALEAAINTPLFNRAEKRVLREYRGGLLSTLPDPDADEEAEEEEDPQQDFEFLKERTGLSKEEIEEMLRAARESAKQDPFSRQSLDNLKESPEDVNLRRLYLDLSKQLHPDLGRDETDRAERTVFMQQVTEAYRRRDFSSLLEIQEGLRRDDSVSPADPEEQNRQSTWLKVVITQLEQQLSVLKRHRAKMNRSKTGKSHKERKKFGGSMNSDIEVGNRFVGRLSSLAITLEKLLDGQVSKTVFVREFEAANAEMLYEDFDDEEMDEEIEAEIEILFQESLKMTGKKDTSRKKRDRDRSRKVRR